MGVIWNIVNIIIFFLLLKKFLFKPVTQMMENRQKAIDDSIKDADEKKAEAYQLKSNYEEELKNAADQATAIIKEARERAEIEYNRILKEAKDETVKVREEANRQIELERKKTMENAQAEIAKIALLAASKIIGRNVDEDTNKQFFGDFLNEVGGSK
jgi:F-type H+-transporting ATPase subunit b